MTRKLQLLLFVCGSAVFAYLVARIGVGQLLADAARTGWLFVPIVLLYGVVCACNAGAWWLSMADEPSRPPFWRAYAITVASFSSTRAAASAPRPWVRSTAPATISAAPGTVQEAR